MKASSAFAIALSCTAALLVTAGCAGTSTTSSGTAESPAASAPAASSPAAVAQSAQPAVLLSGSFVSGEHPTSGTVRILQEGDKRILELDAGFETSTAGPDLVVILHRSDNVIGSTNPPAFPIQEGDYVLLAPLAQYSGAQRYEIPATVNLEEFKSAAVWCRQFNATFGAAALTAS